MTALATTLGLALGTAGTAQARTACPDETLPATAANAGRVVAAVDCLVEEQRARFGLPAFDRDARLDTSATLHSADMVANDYFAHVDRSGNDPDDRARAQGYTAGAGENIAYGYDTALAVMQGWMASAGHCENLLSSAKDLGLGLALADDGTVFVTQSFGNYGSDTAAAALCPVADLDSPVSVPGATSSAPGPGATPAPAAAHQAAAPAAATTAPPRLVVRLSMGRRWTISGAVKGLTGTAKLRVKVAGRTRSVLAHGGRFALHLQALRARRVPVTVSSPAQPGVAAGRLTVTFTR